MKKRAAIVHPGDAIPTPAGCTNDCPGGTGAAYFPPVPAMPSTN